MYQVMIVEDEVILRQGIVNLIDWHGLGCEVCADFSDGETALSWLKNHFVDLLITDIQMPGMNGLELIRHGKQLYPGLLSILLTAYASFDYAQTAISLGVNSYIVKSNFYKELPLSVAHVLASQTPNFIPPESTAGQKLKSILFSAIQDQTLNNPEEISDWLSWYRIPSSNYHLLLAEIQLSSHKSDSDPGKEYQVVENLFHLAFQKLDSSFIWLLNHNLMGIIHFTETKHYNKKLQQLIIACNEILSTAKGYLPFSINIGISLFQTAPQGFSLACRQAQSCLATVLGHNQLSLYKTPADSSVNTLPHSFEFYLETLMELLHKNMLKPEIDSWVLNLLSEYETAFSDFHKLKTHFLQLCSRLFVELNDSSIEPEELRCLESSFYRDIMKAQTLHQIANLLSHTICRIQKLRLVFYPPKDQIHEKVDAIISAEYSHNLKLEHFALRLNMNVSYLCRVYKKETGTSIIAALNQYRILQAKKLLKNPNLRISEIGCLVGIEDPAYFTTVFARYTGMNPQKYREML